MKRTEMLGENTALIVVDAQRKFPVDVPDWESVRDAGVAGINRYAEMFRKAGRPVFLMYFEGESHSLYEGDDGDEWLQGLHVEPSDIVVVKRYMSSFKGNDLEEQLRSRGVDCVLICGPYAEFCVSATYFSAAERDFWAYLAHGALISWNNPGGCEAAEMLCGTVDEETVRRKLGL